MEHKGVLFVAGVAVGSLAGLVIGSIVAGKLGREIHDLAQGFTNKLFHEEKTVKFELLLQ